MHLSFAAARGRRTAQPDAGSAADATRIMVVRDPDDESEWQYLGNPEIATTTSLHEVVTRFLADCSGVDGALDPECRDIARQVRDALLAAARQVDDALGARR